MGMTRFLTLSLLMGVLYSSHAQISQVKHSPAARLIPAEHAQLNYTTPLPVDDVPLSSASSGMSDYVIQPLDPTLAPAPTPFYQSSDSSSASSSSSDRDVVQYLDKPSTPSVPVPAEITVPPPRYTPTVPAPAPAPAPPPTSTIAPFTQTIRENYEAAREASARAARTMSGKQDEGFVALAALISCCGVAAVIVVGVYLRRRSRGDLSRQQEAVTTPYPLAHSSQRRPPPTLTHRPSRAESVYDDPLGTRFSSIVMITPGGDGVCIL